MSTALLPARGRFAFWLSAPVLLWQGQRVRRRAPRFPAAAGPSHGASGDGGPGLRLLGLGDSIIAGVGASTLADAMVGQAALELSDRLHARVAWRAVGEIGARAERVLEIACADEGESPDLILLSVGVNDVTAARRTSAWQHDLERLLDRLHAKHPAARIVLAGLPPLGGFPLLPQPLRRLLGWRARWFDHVAQREAARRPWVLHVPIAFETVPEAFSADGYHPSESSHRIFGQTIADTLVHWLERDDAV